MRGRFLAWALMGLVLLAGGVHAQSEFVQTTAVTLDLVQTEAGIDVLHTVDLNVTDAAFDGNLSVLLPAQSEVQSATVTDGAGVVQLLPGAGRVDPGANAADPEQFVFNLWETGLVPNATAGMYTVSLSYSVPGVLTYHGRLTAGADMLLVFARPLDDYEVVGVNLGTWAQVGDGRVHTAVSDAPGQASFAVTFQPVVSPVRDFTAYAWGVSGLAVGLFAMWVMVKQGYVTIRRSKKFEKGGHLESRDMLEARRRTLMSALKELETAHDAGEIPDAAYAPLKEEYKAQAVRAMRSLEAKKE